MIVNVEVNPGRIEAILTEFHRNVPTVSAESGCIEYNSTVDLKTDLPPQIPLREKTVTIVEKWESLPVLRAHFQAPHMATYRERVKDLVARVSFQVLEPG